MKAKFLSIIGLVLFLGCGDDAPPPSAPNTDGGVVVDVGTGDGTPVDSGSSDSGDGGVVAVDSGTTPDATPADAGSGQGDAGNQEECDSHCECRNTCQSEFDTCTSECLGSNRCIPECRGEKNACEADCRELRQLEKDKEGDSDD